MMNIYIKIYVYSMLCTLVKIMLERHSKSENCKRYNQICKITMIDGHNPQQI